MVARVHPLPVLQKSNFFAWRFWFPCLEGTIQLPKNLAERCVAKLGVHQPVVISKVSCGFSMKKDNVSSKLSSFRSIMQVKAKYIFQTTSPKPESNFPIPT